MGAMNDIEILIEEQNQKIEYLTDMINNIIDIIKSQDSRLNIQKNILSLENQRINNIVEELEKIGTFNAKEES